MLDAIVIASNHIIDTSVSLVIGFFFSFEVIIWNSQVHWLFA